MVYRDWREYGGVGEVEKEKKNQLYIICVKEIAEIPWTRGQLPIKTCCRAGSFLFQAAASSFVTKPALHYQCMEKKAVWRRKTYSGSGCLWNQLPFPNEKFRTKIVYLKRIMSRESSAILWKVSFYRSLIYKSAWNTSSAARPWMRSVSVSFLASFKYRLEGTWQWRWGDHCRESLAFICSHEDHILNTVPRFWVPQYRKNVNKQQQVQ